MSNFYAGIGSRETPVPVLTLMTKIGRKLAEAGYVLRSGGANGADMAFEMGAGLHDNKQMEIYIPWKGFNGHNPSMTHIVPLPNPLADELVKKFHPAPGKLSNGAMKLMARNAYQVLGHDLKTPVQFVICWTKCGGKTDAVGGTGQAVRIANHYNIPVYNLGNQKDYDRLAKWIG